MNIIKPCPELEPFISGYAIMQYDGIVENFVLPNPFLVMAIRFKGSVNVITADETFGIPLGAVTGIQRYSRTIRYENAGNILAFFKPTGARAFFSDSLLKFENKHLDLSSVNGFEDVEILVNAARNTATETDMIKQMESYLISKIRNTTTDKLITSAIDIINHRHGDIKVRALAEALFMSQDAFTKRFRKRVGTTPKYYCQLVKFRNALKAGNLDKKLTDLALEGGYFDQAHFNHIFKRLVDLNPSELRKKERVW